MPDKLGSIYTLGNIEDRNTVKDSLLITRSSQKKGYRVLLRGNFLPSNDDLHKLARGGEIAYEAH